MTLILLAISLTIAACVIAYNLAIYALPVMVAITAAQYTWGAGAGLLMSGFAAIGAALLSIALVIVVLGFAKNPMLRLIALALFAVPAVIAGYALVYGITQNAIDSGLVLNLLGGTGGLVIGVSAIVNLNALGESVFSRRNRDCHLPLPRGKLGGLRRRDSVCPHKCRAVCHRCP